MKVSELIELLEEQDPDAEVLLAMQENWPFECAIEGVTSREESLEAERDEDDEDEDDDAKEPRLDRGTARNDVFIVEGNQLRYGSKTAWAGGHALNANAVPGEIDSSRNGLAEGVNGSLYVLAGNGARAEREDDDDVHEDHDRLSRLRQHPRQADHRADRRHRALHGEASEQGR